MRQRSSSGADAAGRSLPWVWVAAVLGLVHAAFSAYWALGGQWLLDTVGHWAVDLRASSPRSAGTGLGLIALVKVAAALIPVAVTRGRFPLPRLWRVVSWIGSIGLILYGGANTLVSNLVLLGVMGDGAFDRAAMIGHAWLWDPLFLLWGLALLIHLVLSRSLIPRAPARSRG
jgi:hypothetical protein